MSRLVAENLKVLYPGDRDAVLALADFNLDITEGGMTVLLGESGCGKSTALNAVAGLLQPNQGAIRLGEKVIFNAEAGINLASNHRDIGMVFQSYALWPHLTVSENVAYPLRRRKKNRQEIAQRVEEALVTVRCQLLSDRFPGELSGGQQQRVALARALVARPRLILFDEPLSNLDASLRRELRDELARLHREIGFTGLYVTHDQTEALSLGTEVAVMGKGRIVQSGTPDVVYGRPTSEFVARFFGANVLAGRITNTEGNVSCINTELGVLECPGHIGSQNVKISFMPQSAHVDADPSGPLTVVSEMFVGAHREITLERNGHSVLVVAQSQAVPLGVGARASLHVPKSEIIVFPDNVE